jgi:hypothetical protein
MESFAAIWSRSIDRQLNKENINMTEHRNHRPPSDRPAPNIIKSERFEIENKTFFLDLIENSRGRVVRITEDVKGRRDRIMVPHDALTQMAEALQRLQS